MEIVQKLCWLHRAIRADGNEKLHNFSLAKEPKHMLIGVQLPNLDRMRQ